MNTSKTAILTAAIIATLAMLLLMIRFLMRKAPVSDAAGTIKLSLGIWFASLFLPGALQTGKTVTVLAEVIDHLYKLNASNSFLSCFKTASLLIGLNMLWLILWYSIANILSVITTREKNRKSRSRSGSLYLFPDPGHNIHGFRYLPATGL